MPPSSYIEGMDRPTVLYILYTMVSEQQTNLLPKYASRNDAILPKIFIAQYCSTWWVAQGHIMHNSTLLLFIACVSAIPLQM